VLEVNSRRTAPRRRRLGVRQLAAAFMPHLLKIELINRAFKEGASRLAHSKGFAAGKNYTPLGVPPQTLMYSRCCPLVVGYNVCAANFPTRFRMDVRHNK
jgi:hypothetical protein